MAGHLVGMLNMIDTFRFGTAATAVLALVTIFAMVGQSHAPDDERLELSVRSRNVVTTVDGQTMYVEEGRRVVWDAKKTALVICDMWDRHWCAGAERRVGELAGPMNEVVKIARDRGMLVVHAPSTCVDFYKGTAARRRAMDARMVKSPVPLATKERWGTAWCWPDKKREPELPIDDSDMGCDCREKCKIRTPWTRQIATIEIKDEDAITDNGQETINLFAQRGIDNVIILGVHTNMCVLGRPFAIRQMVNVRKKVVLVRDMTDTMYNHEMAPMVDHFTGTDLVVEHIERHWCPTMTSSELTGKAAFRFREDKRER
jgi:nicotinamidase-related amidase